MFHYIYEDVKKKDIEVNIRCYGNTHDDIRSSIAGEYSEQIGSLAIWNPSTIPY